MMGLAFGQTHLYILSSLSNNKDLEYDPITDQIQVRGATAMLCWFGDRSHDFLIANLDDEDSFAAAHVALTRQIHDSDTMLQHADTNRFCYFRLQGKLLESNELVFDFDSRPPLKDWWIDYSNKIEVHENLTVSSGVLFFGTLDETSTVDASPR